MFPLFSFSRKIMTAFFHPCRVIQTFLLFVASETLALVFVSLAHILQLDSSFVIYSVVAVVITRVDCCAGWSLLFVTCSTTPSVANSSTICDELILLPLIDLFHVKHYDFVVAIMIAVSLSGFTVHHI